MAGSAAAVERPLPHNLEAERCVLGAILIHNDAFNVAVEFIDADDFYRHAHQRVFDTMVGLNEHGQAIDFVTVKDELIRAGTLDDVGGPAYIAALADGVPRSTNVDHYARIVKEKSTLRRLIRSANRIVTTAYQAEQDADAVLDDAEREIFSIAEDRVHSGFVPLSVLVDGAVTAIERFIDRHPEHRGTVALLVTSDEEGPSVNGVRRVMEALGRRGERIDWCLVGEPSSTDRLGDTVKIGRRGSLNGTIAVRGVQGHIAYPHLARNPVHDLARLLAKLADTVWDEGSEHFPPTSFQVSNVTAGTGADNVIPGHAEAVFNFRYSTRHDRGSLVAAVESACRAFEIDCDIDWRLSGEPFLTEPGRLIEAVGNAVEAVAGLRPELSTAGGTSDGRFVAPTGAEVVELGPVNATIHSIDERVLVVDLDRLSEMYERVVTQLLAD